MDHSDSMEQQGEEVATVVVSDDQPMQVQEAPEHVMEEAGNDDEEETGLEIDAEPEEVEVECAETMLAKMAELQAQQAAQAAAAQLANNQAVDAGKTKEGSESSDEDMSDDSDSESSESSEEEEVKTDKVTKVMEEEEEVPNEYFGTRHEVKPSELPPVEELAIVLPENVQLELLGLVKNIVGDMIVIESREFVPALDMDSIVWYEDRTPMGRVFETFGRVERPLYSVRIRVDGPSFAKAALGNRIFYAPNEPSVTAYVLTEQLKAIKGSDASWEDDEEPPEDYVEYSDDEQEMQAKSANKKRKKRGGAASAAAAGATEHATESTHTQGPSHGHGRGGHHNGPRRGQSHQYSGPPNQHRHQYAPPSQHHGQGWQNYGPQGVMQRDMYGMPITTVTTGEDYTPLARPDVGPGPYQPGFVPGGHQGFAPGMYPQGAYGHPAQQNMGHPGQQNMGHYGMDPYGAE
eukprot:Colp12_sorted_trinity150504_noHs@33931